MNLNQESSIIKNLLLQKRERKLSENLKNPLMLLNNTGKNETEMSRPFPKNSEKTSIHTKTRYGSNSETNQNQEYNIIPPTIKPGNSRRMSLNSNESRTICNCKNSQCLKLYCECFATMSYCDPKLCSCKNCMNTVENEVSFYLKLKEIRKNSINNYFIKSPNSFKKIITNQLFGYSNVSNTVAIPNLDIGISVFRSCTCKKSNCLKRYCECYQSGLSCNPQCKCLSWYNMILL
jgi:hypothetical protein